MPAWGTGKKTNEEESWRLVRFIRHLPRITPEEIEQMEGLNPKSPERIRQYRPRLRQRTNTKGSHEQELDQTPCPSPSFEAYRGADHRRHGDVHNSCARDYTGDLLHHETESAAQGNPKDVIDDLVTQQTMAT
jgi:hypothetical protein